MAQPSTASDGLHPPLSSMKHQKCQMHSDCEAEGLSFPSPRHETGGSVVFASAHSSHRNIGKDLKVSRSAPELSLNPSSTSPLSSDEEEECSDDEDDKLISAGRATSSGLHNAPPMVYFLTVVAAIGGFLFGFDTGVISGALLYMTQEFNLQDWEQELVVSMTVMGAFLGSLAANFISRTIGGKWTIVSACCMFMIGSALLASAVNLWMIYSGRMIVGLGVGVASMAVPVYIAETAPRRMRGALISIDVLFICFGTFASYSVDAIFANVDGTWRWMLGSAFVPAFLQFCGMLFLPQSPRYLLRIGENGAALRVLLSLRGEKENAKAEFARMQAAKESQRQFAHKNKFLEIIQKPYIRRALIAGIGLQIIQQFAGINTVMYYSPTILQMAGIGDGSNTTSIYASMVVAAVNSCFTVVGVLAIDRIGRRPLLLVSLVGTVLSLCLLATSFALLDQSPVWSYMCLVALGLYVMSFAPGMGPVPWAYNGEIYPLYVRATATSISTAASWGSNLLISISFLTLSNALTSGGTFGLYAFFALLGLIFVFLCVPETKGLPLEAVKRLFKDGRWAFQLDVSDFLPASVVVAASSLVIDGESVNYYGAIDQGKEGAFNEKQTRSFESETLV